MNSFRQTAVKNTMVIYVNSFRPCQPYFPVESHKLYLVELALSLYENKMKRRPILQLCFLFILYLSMQLFVHYYKYRSGPGWLNELGSRMT
jgi:hypothetical protein